MGEQVTAVLWTYMLKQGGGGRGLGRGLGLEKGGRQKKKG